jgi:hypothetical protein
MLNGLSIPQCVKAAGSFISAAIECTIERKSSLKEGVIFEPVLYRLSEYIREEK